MPVITGISGGAGTGAIVQFVDSIGTTPVVRFDFNNLEPAMVTKIDLSPPPLRYAKSATMLADGERVNASAYGNRMIGVDVEFQSASQDAASAALSALALELDRPNNILRVQVGTFVTFFRTYRSSFTWGMANSDTTYITGSASVEAEPFGLGLMQTAATAATVSSDPTSGGRCLDFSGVLGDVETPAQIVYSDNGSPQQGTVVFGVRRRGTPSLVTHWVQAESQSMGTDTAIATSHDTTMSGAGNNYTRTTFATNTTMVNRVGFQWPSASTVDARGAYRVFARVRMSGTGTVSVTATYNGIPTGVTVTFPAAGFTYLFDLGTINVPQGTDPIVNGYSNTQMAVAPGPIWVQASGPGTASFDTDFVYLMPADDTFTAVTWSSSLPVGSYSVLDGVSDSVYQILDPTSTPWAVTPSTHTYTGSLPMLSPGSNRMYLLNRVYSPTSNAADALVGVSTVTVRYWPRYLSLATA